MYRTFVTVFLCLLIVAAQGCIPPPSKPVKPRVSVRELFEPEAYKRIAVYVRDESRKRSRRRHSSQNEGILREIEDIFMQALLDKGYILAARSDIDQIIKELDMQHSNITERAIAQKAKALNVSAVLIVSINQLSTSRYSPMIRVRGERYFLATASISARLLVADRAEIVLISSHSGDYIINDKRDSYKALVPVAHVVASGIPSR